MAGIFTEVASIDYPIIDADAHVYEPPDVWQARVPATLRGRAPRVERTDEGDVWLFDNGARVRAVGLMAAAGTSYLGFRPHGLTYEGIRRGHWDGRARLGDMDADGIWAQLLYPSVCEEGARMFGDERATGTTITFPGLSNLGFLFVQNQTGNASIQIAFTNDFSAFAERRTSG